MEIRVKNFGKIKEANITLDDYTIFVGDNNSGKTYLMQLMYGLFLEFQHVEGVPNTLFKTLPFKIDSTNIAQVVGEINKWLNKEKKRIVKKIFNGSVKVESIEINVGSEEINGYCAEVALLNEIDNDIINREEYNDSKGPFFCLIKDQNKIILDDNFSLRRHKAMAWDFLVSRVMEDLLSTGIGSDSLYLPASRSGLNLVYKEIFANQISNRFSEMDKNNKKSPEKLGVTKPVFDYMLFLHKYRADAEMSSVNKGIIDFINRKVLKGRISHIDNNVRYTTDSGVNLPLYLSSSMVNELSPIVKLLTSVNDICNIFYDEIETSQHPTTQIQLARLLNRLVNLGYRIIVSTHSDTMAAAINNMIALPNLKKEERNLKLKKYEKNDSLNAEKKIRAYQFISQNGRSVVKEVPRYKEIGLGFDFTLFDKSNEILVDDYNAIHGEG